MHFLCSICPAGDTDQAPVSWSRKDPPQGSLWYRASRTGQELPNNRRRGSRTGDLSNLGYMQVGTDSMAAGIIWQLGTSTTAVASPASVMWGDDVTLDIAPITLNPSLQNLTGNYTAYLTRGDLPAVCTVPMSGNDRLPVYPHLKITKHFLQHGYV